MFKFLRQVKQHPAVAPVFLVTILGASFAATAVIRTAAFHPDVSWDRKNNQHPWLKVKPDQHTKFIKVYDYSKLKDQRPKINN